MVAQKNRAFTTKCIKFLHTVCIVLMRNLVIYLDTDMLDCINIT